MCKNWTFLKDVNVVIVPHRNITLVVPPFILAYAAIPDRGPSIRRTPTPMPIHIIPTTNTLFSLAVFLKPLNTDY